MHTPDPGSPSDGSGSYQSEHEFDDYDNEIAEFAPESHNSPPSQGQSQSQSQSQNTLQTKFQVAQQSSGSQSVRRRVGLPGGSGGAAGNRARRKEQEMYPFMGGPTRRGGTSNTNSWMEASRNKDELVDGQLVDALRASECFGSILDAVRYDLLWTRIWRSVR